MVRIPWEESAGPERSEAELVDPADPLRRVVHITLAIYLMPVVAIVSAIGGVAILFERATRLASRVAADARGDIKPGPVPITGSRSSASISREQRRIRVGR